MNTSHLYIFRMVFKEKSVFLLIPCEDHGLEFDINQGTVVQSDECCLCRSPWTSVRLSFPTPTIGMY